SDGDGVLDGMDQCPATPAGATVDTNGCPSDSDGDGVLDGLDQCPATPAGATVDTNGCSSDSDGDGVLDGLDQCPATPAGATVDTNGCSSDSDGDGVLDGIDQCPATPAGTSVDGNGCPVTTPPPPDSDGDGVPDSSDLCPGTPPGTPVGNTGCPITAPPPDSDGDGVPDSSDRCPGTSAGTPVDAKGCPVRSQKTEPVYIPPFRFNDGRLETMLDGHTAIYLHDGTGNPAIHIYRTDDFGNAYLTLARSLNELNQYPDRPEANMLIGTGIDGKVALYKLTSGEYQINVGPDSDGKIYIIVLPGLGGAFNQSEWNIYK
ncbi:MAG: thrombospondin type 3 repeat-containing protein, partial [Chloroflexi bacterium]|nr:thrombospondin type 3 repeat-containing protein [Chloroflexota bacterium]